MLITADSFNVFGHSGETTSQAFVNFTPGGNDVNATSNGGGTPTALASLLKPLADNGGLTQTHALVKDSIAIDLDATCSAGMTEDQRGIARPVGLDYDAGAYEYKQVNMTPIYKLLLLKK